jgi:hypothetical protein
MKKIMSYLLLVLITILQTMYMDTRYSYGIGGETHLLLAYVYGGLFSAEETSELLIVIEYSSSLFLQLILLSDIMHSDFEMACVYLFTRNGSRTKWFVGKGIKTFVSSLLILFCQMIITMLIGSIRGYHLDVLRTARIFLMLLLTLGIGSSIFTVLSALFSIRNNGALVISVVLLVFMMSILLIPLMSGVKGYFEINPVCRTFLLHHSITNSIEGIDAFNGLSIITTLVYFISLHVLILAGGCIWINRKDVLEVM